MTWPNQPLAPERPEDGFPWCCWQSRLRAHWSLTPWRGRPKDLRTGQAVESLVDPSFGEAHWDDHAAGTIRITPVLRTRSAWVIFAAVRSRPANPGRRPSRLWRSRSSCSAHGVSSSAGPKRSRRVRPPQLLQGESGRDVVLVADNRNAGHRRTRDCPAPQDFTRPPHSGKGPRWLAGRWTAPLGTNNDPATWRDARR